MNDEQKKRQFMVIHNQADGKMVIVKVNLNYDEAMALCKTNKYYGIGNVNNYFADHDCSLSQDKGCKICEILFNAKHVNN